MHNHEEALLNITGNFKEAVYKDKKVLGLDF